MTAEPHDELEKALATPILLLDDRALTLDNELSGRFSSVERAAESFGTQRETPLFAILQGKALELFRQAAKEEGGKGGFPQSEPGGGLIFLIHGGTMDSRVFPPGITEKAEAVRTLERFAARRYPLIVELVGDSDVGFTPLPESYAEGLRLPNPRPIAITRSQLYMNLRKLLGALGESPLVPTVIQRWNEIMRRRIYPGLGARATLAADFEGFRHRLANQIYISKPLKDLILGLAKRDTDAAGLLRQGCEIAVKFRVSSQNGAPVGPIAWTVERQESDHSGGRCQGRCAGAGRYFAVHDLRGQYELRFHDEEGRCWETDFSHATHKNPTIHDGSSDSQWLLASVTRFLDRLRGVYDSAAEAKLLDPVLDFLEVGWIPALRIVAVAGSLPASYRECREDVLAPAARALLETPRRLATPGSATWISGLERSTGAFEWLISTVDGLVNRTTEATK